MAITLTDSKIKKRLSQFGGHFGKTPYFDIYDLDEDSASKKSKKSALHSKRIKDSGSKILPTIVKVTPKHDHYKSSTPLAAQIYKANSDEFRKRVKKKVKKSVLTLPNQRIVRPKDHTVSDTNDSDYAQKSLDFLSKKNPVACEKASWSSKEDFWPIKRNMKHTRAVQSPPHSKRRYKHHPSNETSQLKPHNIWGVLRSMNRFQFPRSPPMSDDDSDKTKKGKARKNLDYDMDEDVDMDSEIYGVDIEIKSKSSEYSRDSSYGTTVIETGESNKKFTKQPKVSFKERTQFASRIPKQLNKPIQYLNRQKKEAKGVLLSQNVRKNEMEMLSKEHKPEIHHRTDATKDKDGTRSPKIHKFSVVTAIQDTPKDRFKKTLPRPVIRVKPDANQIRNVLKPAVLVTARKSVHEQKTLEHLDRAFEGVSNNGEFIAVNDIKWSQFDTKSNSRINLRENRKNETEKALLRRPPMRANVSGTIPRRATFTVPEIKRKLELTRFPIVVTEKNEVSSGFQVCNYDQFNGIDEKIWPFMVDWVNRKKISAKSNVDQTRAVVKTNAPLNKTRCILNDNVDKILKDNKEPKRNPRQGGKENQNITTIATMRQTNKSKQIHKLRDDMLKVLYKNSSVGYYIKPDQMDMLGQNMGGKSIQPKFVHPKSLSALMPSGTSKISPGGSSHNHKAIAIKNSMSNLRTNNPDSGFKNRVASVIQEESPRPENRPRRFGSSWPKANWASDFIETVISKIKKGIYCTSENIPVDRSRQQVRRENRNHLNKNVLIQKPPPVDYKGAITEVYESDDDDITQFYDAENDPLRDIDGFDKPVSEVELRSITKDTIVMKSVVANVVLHFDVVLALNKLKVDPNLDYIPVGKTESQTKIIKCSTSVVNAILPAQLCALIPGMMKGLKEFSESEQFKTMSFEATDAIIAQKPELPQMEMSPTCTALSIVELTPKHSELVNGSFAPKLETKSISTWNFKDISFHGYHEQDPARELRFLNIDFRAFVFTDIEPLLKIPLLSSPPAFEVVTEPPPLSEPNVCKALVLYDPLEHSLVRLVGWEAITRPLKILYDHFKYKLTQQKETLDSALSRREDSAKKAMETTEPLVRDSKPIVNIKMPIRKLRHMRYKKMYRKCKISDAINNKVNPTALQSISNLGDFFKCLTSGKECLANAFDSPVEGLLMSYVAQAKTWISEITPNQSLLLLLLANKKQTANLVRFSEIVVQAIAVNRITKSSELEMEIEVIEKERFNSISELIEITSSTSLSAARKNLYDELVWIAKTTAADHQRPFDESSEKQLTTLLDKRKNLNPSYLRVMARYVGLGLLKTTKRPT